MGWLENLKRIFVVPDKQLDGLCSELRQESHRINEFLFTCSQKLKREPEGPASALLECEEFNDAVNSFTKGIEKLDIQENVWMATSAASPSTPLRTKAMALAKEFLSLSAAIPKAEAPILASHLQTIKLLEVEIEAMDKAAVEVFIATKSNEIDAVLGFSSTSQVYDDLAKSKAILVVVRTFINAAGARRKKHEESLELQKGWRENGIGTSLEPRHPLKKLGQVTSEDYRNLLPLIDRWGVPIDEFIARIIAYHEAKRKTQ